MSVSTQERTLAAAGQAERLRWSPPRVMSSITLATWAGLFWFLMISGRTTLYLSSRTDWVVPMGAIVLTIAALGRLASAKQREPEVISRRDALWMGLIIVPVVTVLALPPASLGGYAASRRSSLTSGSFVSSAEDIRSGDLSLVDVSGALRSPEAMRVLVGRAGETVDFTGFVTKESGMSANEFILTRFLISCCVADALSAQVRVVGAPPGGFKADEWVRVEGQFYPLGKEVIVDASEVAKVSRPKHPYLSP
jgi:uncharacterized repeat protein (TIGR03943 family)